MIPDIVGFILGLEIAPVIHVPFVGPMLFVGKELPTADDDSIEA